MVKTYKSMMDVFNDPFLIGFSREFDRLSSLQKDNSSVSYPPYNVVRYDEDNYRLDLAVAGFTIEDLDISVKDGKLVIKGEQPQEDEKEQFVHRGIATRKFTRSFALAEHMEVKAAGIADGILSVPIIRVVPDEKKPRQIEIIDHSTNNKY